MNTAAFLRGVGRGVALVLLGCVTGPVLAAVNRVDEAVALIRQGQAFEAQKDYAKAIDAYRRATEAAPTEAAPYIQLGWAEHLAGNEAAALAHLSTADTFAPDNAKILLRLGLVHRDLKQLSKAVPLLVRASRLDPRSAQAPTALAGCLFQTGDFAGAATALSTAIERSPNDPELFRQRAVVREKLGQKTEALVDVSRGTALARTDKEKQDLAALRTRLTATGEPRASGPALPAAPAMGRGPVAPRLALTMPAAQKIDFAKLSGARYAAAVSSAQDLLGLVLGPRTAAENARLEAAWAAAFDFPAPEVVTYLNALNPLLAQFVSFRAGAALLLDQFTATWTEAMLAAGQGNRAAAEDIMVQGQGYREQLRTVQAELRKVQKAIEALGDMPDPAVANRRARQLADSALAFVADPAAEEILGQLQRQGGLRIEVRQQRRLHETGWNKEAGQPFDRQTDEKSAVYSLLETIPITWDGQVLFGSRRSSGADGGTFDLGVWGEISSDARTMKSLLFFSRVFSSEDALVAEPGVRVLHGRPYSGAYALDGRALD